MIDKAATFIREAKNVIIGTGAGFGIDSGLPDFRGANGFWNNYPPYRGKFQFTQCANPQFLRSHPHLFWGFYGSRLQMYREKQPHQGFHMLKQMAQIIRKKNKIEGNNLFVVTSNVDGHFQKAGYSDEYIYQVHGSINHLQCYECNKIYQNQFIPEVNYELMSSKNLAVCQSCQSLVRPNILMFGDWQWLSDRSDKQERNYNNFLRSIKGQETVIIESGAGTGIPTIRLMMQEVYNRNKNSKFIRINPDKMISSSSYMPSDRYVDIHLPALEAITKIRQKI